MRPGGGASTALGQLDGGTDGAGQPRPRGLPRGTTLLLATAVPHAPHMALHALEEQPQEKGHLVVHQRRGPA